MPTHMIPTPLPLLVPNPSPTVEPEPVMNPNPIPQFPLPPEPLEEIKQEPPTPPPEPVSPQMIGSPPLPDIPLDPELIYQLFPFLALNPEDEAITAAPLEIVPPVEQELMPELEPEPEPEPEWEREEEEEVEEEEDEGEVVEEIEEGDVSDISSVGDNEELLNRVDEFDNLIFPYEIYEGLLMMAIDEYQAACIEKGTPIAQYRRYMVRMRSIYDNSGVNGIVYPLEQWKKVLLYFLPRTPE
ncbi:hypothetical protein K1719_000091 [Acacia pycnantha]|nr:hypothetical protein K1719_000091 [Acacia pycnantha]